MGAPGCAVSEDQESLDPTVGGADSTSAGSQTALAAAGANPGMAGYTSFPVDVIVYFHMQVILMLTCCDKDDIQSYEVLDLFIKLKFVDSVFSVKLFNFNETLGK